MKHDSERATQDRIIQLFVQELGYTYLGNWQHQPPRHHPIEDEALQVYLMEQVGATEAVAQRTVQQLVHASKQLADGLYTANKALYSMLRYGVNVTDENYDTKQTVYPIDWANPHNNRFGIAEEVAVARTGGASTCRPDLVLYVNGIALGVVELKSSRVDVQEGVYQNINNQASHYAPHFFTTMQLVLAGNDSQGLRYGTVGTPAKYFLTWKEDASKTYPCLLDQHLAQLCRKERLLELAHDFVVFDRGVKKICRHNQYFGIKAAQERLHQGRGGLLFHTQGSGKSLLITWLTKWVLQTPTLPNSRVLIITDREELDAQIQKLFQGVGEPVRRIGYHNNGKKRSYPGGAGRELLDVLNQTQDSLICSLIHKFGNRNKKEGDVERYLQELQDQLYDDFEAKGNLYVWVDEAHRTQSGDLHKAMKKILPNAIFVGFTGTPLLKKDKKTTLEVFGSYIGQPYRFDEAVADGVVVDLIYEARDVEQYINDQEGIDQWFDRKTKGLNRRAKTQLKQNWGTMQKVRSSRSRLDRIVRDIVSDFGMIPTLEQGIGNAMLVTDSVYQACLYYELFQSFGFLKCAIITSYVPNAQQVRTENIDSAQQSEALTKYNTYVKMLNGKTPEDFEKKVKETFIEEPHNMKLLIVVDKLLTGFDAPSATYLYIDKSMKDHGLFQAICRVNRLGHPAKEYGYIIDYKDLFHSLEQSIKDYTKRKGFDGFDDSDVDGLVKERYAINRERIESALEALFALCESVHPQTMPAFRRYFCGDPCDPDALEATDYLRDQLYRRVAKLARAYADSSGEWLEMRYTIDEAKDIEEKVNNYTKLRDDIKLSSGDKINLKQYEADMRRLMDMYLDANRRRTISDFENTSLVQLIEQLAGHDTSPSDAVNEPDPPYGSGHEDDRENMAEIIENNVRRTISKNANANPKYYGRMSELLVDLIKQRRAETIAYEAYLAKIKLLAEQVEQPSQSQHYPSSIDSSAKQALYDNLAQNEPLALTLDTAILEARRDSWRGNIMKERRIWQAIQNIVDDETLTEELLRLVKAQKEY